MPLYYSNFKSFSNKISRIFLFEQLYVRPLLAILKGQYRPWARRGRPEQGWYGWISTFWCHSKLPYDGQWISGLTKQIMPTLTASLIKDIVELNLSCQNQNVRACKGLKKGQSDSIYCLQHLQASSCNFYLTLGVHAFVGYILATIYGNLIQTILEWIPCLPVQSFRGLITYG